MLWIDSLLQFSLLGYIRRLSTQCLSQSMEHSIWQCHQSKSHQTRTRKRHRKGRMRPGSYPFNGEFESYRFRKYTIHNKGYHRRNHRKYIGHRFVFSMGKRVSAWLGPIIFFITGLAPILYEACLCTYEYISPSSNCTHSTFIYFFLIHM